MNNPATPSITLLATSDTAMVLDLIREYLAWIGCDLSFQDIDTELADFPGKYAAPDGAFLVARFGAEIVGCVGLRRLDRRTCEMKRLFVRDHAKGHGLGKALVAELLQVASAKGYHRMRLDTLATMHAAQALYRGFGFYEIAAYVHNPLPGTLFMEKLLPVRR